MKTGNIIIDGAAGECGANVLLGGERDEVEHIAEVKWNKNNICIRSDILA